MNNSHNRTKALNPQKSIWVSANAGSGKTTLLTDRILVLLLHNVTPERILALTFTKTAATEMISRIHTRLQNWSIIDHESLKKEITNLGLLCNTHFLHKARILYEEILQSQKTFHVQTIHAFCQFLLKKFPLEANISPYFAILNEEENNLLIEHSLQEIFCESLEEFTNLLENTSYHQLLEVILNIISKNKIHALQTYSNQDLEKKIFHTLKAKKNFLKFIPSNQLENELKKNPSYDSLKKLSDYDNIEHYMSYFITQTGEIKKRILPANLEQQNKSLFLALKKEQKRLIKWDQENKKTSTAKISLALNIIIKKIYKKYEEKKIKKTVLSFEDLIQKVKILLESNNNLWVRYQLHKTIDHILIDESQDTNPDQWSVIKALTEEFFINDQQNKSVFIVGDIKQSIFSFQNADIDSFNESKKFFLKQGAEMISLTESFRGLPNLLQAIDSIFNNPIISPYFPEKSISHTAIRKGNGLIVLEQTENFIYQCVDTINQLLQYSLIEENRAITPSDIMVLFRQRDAKILNTFNAECKKKNIPVNSSISAILLIDNLIIQDCLAAAQWAINPSDDFCLACLLKSPFFHCSEEELFFLSYNRKGTLWQSIQDHQSRYLDLLMSIKNHAHYSAYDFFFFLLYQSNSLVEHFGSNALSIIETFLQYALQLNASLSSFTYHILNNSPKTVTETSNPINAIKLSTVHAAKGLQAPIIMILDPHRASYSMQSYVNNHITWSPIPLWCPKKSLMSHHFFSLLEKNILKEQEEHKRLLYVAMTRARDALYFFSQKNPHPSSWFQIVYTALKKDLIQKNNFCFYGSFPFKGKSSPGSFGGLFIKENNKV